MTLTTAESIQMLDPTVASSTVQHAAPARLSTLDGKTIGLFSNNKLNATEVLEVAAQIIQQRFQPAGFVRVEDRIDFGRLLGDEQRWDEPLDAALVAVGD
jgi:hypothetical protein